MMDRSHRFTWAAFVFLFLALALPLAAEIMPFGDVDPTDPTWWIEGGLINTDSYVGNTSDGSVIVNNGSQLNTNNCYLGYRASGNGRGSVKDTDSLWQARYLYVGYYGFGTIDIENGGKVYTVYSCRLGYESGSSGSVNVSDVDSLLHINGSLRLGLEGYGELNIRNGGEAISINGYCMFGYNLGGCGLATINGADSTWNSDRLYLGYEGAGAMHIENGGTVFSTWNFIGYNPGSSGSVTVTGEGSTWNSSSHLFIGEKGEGLLNIENGGVVNVSSYTSLGRDIAANGKIVFDNGTLNTHGLNTAPQDILGVGIINTTGLFSDIDLVFDHNHGKQQQFILDDEPGQNITVNLNQGATGPLGVGYREQAELCIADGQIVDSNDGILGWHPGSFGVATVTGHGSTWNVGKWFEIGSKGTGYLTVENGGTVNCQIGHIGASFDGIGVVTVIGIESTWNSDSLTAGYYGQGVLNIENGGQVNSDSGYIGGENGLGFATISGDGSVWNISNSFCVGNHSDGSLEVKNGGRLSNVGSASIGYDGSGAVIVTGTNSVWENAGQLIVGSSDEGIVVIENGGSLISNEAYICSSSDGIGTVTINGVGSSWNNSGELQIGYKSYGAIGTLNIENGGSINIGGNLIFIFDHSK